MSVNTAKFVIQRSGSQYTCEGSDLYEKVGDTDLFAIYRSGTLYRGTKDKILDTDYLVCVDGGVTKKVLGSLVKTLVQLPAPLAPIETFVDSVPYQQSQGALFLNAVSSAEC